LEDRLSGYLAAGLFSATEEDAEGNKDMGTELLAEGKYMITKSLGIEFGASYAFLGDFYKEAESGNLPEDLFEVYSRLQVEF
jgi:hypothetical protein